MVVVHNATDLGAAVRAARRAAGLTQAELAVRAGVSRQWLVAVEHGHGRAELDKVNGLLHAVGLTLSTEPAPAVRPERERTRDRDRTWATAAETAEAVRAEIARGDIDFALRVLARGLADFRRLTYPDDVAQFLAEPPSTGDHRWDTLLAASVSRECRQRGIASPAWTRTDPLPSWWFPVFDPVLTARTMQRTPIDLSVRGIWLDRRALELA